MIQSLKYYLLTALLKFLLDHTLRQHKNLTTDDLLWLVKSDVIVVTPGY